MRVSIGPLDPAHARLVHGWVTHPKAVFWEMTDATVHDVADEHARIEEHPHHDAWLGRVDGEPAFLVETYDPARSEMGGLVGLSDLREGDLGMHVLVAPTEKPVPGFTRRVFAAVMRFCFADPAVRRVVVEPDERNDRIRTLNAAAGFTVERLLPMPTKTAALSFCTREAFAASGLARLADETEVGR